MAELMLGQPLFPGESGIDQLVEIIKVLGTPSREQIKTMNPIMRAAAFIRGIGRAKSSMEFAPPAQKAGVSIPL